MLKTMLLAGKYDVLQTIGGAAIIVQRARLAPDGRTVLVHKLGHDSRAFEAMKLALRYAIQNPTSHGSALLDVVDEAESTYIVTEDRPECLSLMDWLPWALAGGNSSSNELTETTPTRSGPSEFTRFFSADEAVPPSHVAPRPDVTESFPTSPIRGSNAPEKGVLRPNRPDTSPSESDARIEGTPAGQPVEFTRLFRNAATDSGEGPGERSTSPAGSANPGEFTRLFGNASETNRAENVPGAGTQASECESPIKRPEPQLPPMPEKSDTGEFTRILRGPGISDESISDKPAPRSSSADPVSPAEPGEFTRLFRNPDPDAIRGLPRGASPAAESQNAGEFGRVLRPQSKSSSPDDPFKIPREDAIENRGAQGETAPPRAPTAGGPGEFTRIIRRPATSEPSPHESVSRETTGSPTSEPAMPKAQSPAFTPPAAVPRPPGIAVPQTPGFNPPAPLASSAPLPLPTTQRPATGRHLSPFLILFGILILVAIALILVFVLRH